MKELYLLIIPFRVISIISYTPLHMSLSGARASLGCFK